jgi:hypothetical protein
MKVNVTVECTPAEARAFMGLPDVEPLNNFLIEQMKGRMAQNIQSMQPDELLKSWSSFGVTAQDQFFKIMQSAAKASMSGFDAVNKK